MTTQTLPFTRHDWRWRQAVRSLLFIAIIATAGLTPIRTTAASEPIQPFATAPTPMTNGGDAPAAPMERGKLAFLRGDFAAAATDFKKAITLYEGSADKSHQLEALLALAQTDQLTGQFRKALEILERALAMANEQRDKRQIAAVENGIGNARLGLGHLELANNHLQAALALAIETKAQDIAASVLNNLGNLYTAQSKNAEAAATYRESATKATHAGNMMLAATAAINGATSAQRDGKHAEAVRLLATAIKQLHHTEDSYAKASNLINAGLCYAALHQNRPQDKELVRQAYTVLNEALSVAKSISNQRTASYALGFLGNIYEEQGQLQEALTLTQTALFAAQLQNTVESLYRWHWQNGRLLARSGDIDGAIVSYRYAIGDLKKIREEMDSCYATPERSYQKTAKMICAELVDLLLRKASSVQKETDVHSWLVEARDAVEILKVFELREYFKDDCIDASRSVNQNLDTISNKIVVFYPLLLRDRVELLVSFSGKLKRITLPVEVEVFTKEVRAFRNTLVKNTTREFLPHAQKLYDWLIRPLERDLEAMQPETLVFVPDGPLRTVPMAALHDGHQFLLARYQIAVTPSLNLTDPRPMKQEGARILSMGVTQAVQGFPELPYVADELKDIGKFFTGPVLLDGNFRLANVEQELKKEPFSMVHIASHGQFGGNPSETFLLAYDERFPMERLGEYVGLFRFREDPLDLLVLSACETAAGDDRAALGLAGVAVRAGARSALATLWHVYDSATYELIVEFYRQLHTLKVSRAAALQAAQRKLAGDKRFEHPCYWAPFLLINNWL